MVIMPNGRHVFSRVLVNSMANCVILYGANVAHTGVKGAASWVVRYTMLAGGNRGAAYDGYFLSWGGPRAYRYHALTCFGFLIDYFIFSETSNGLRDCL